MDTKNLPRAPHIHYDYTHLWTDIGSPPELTESTKAYVEHLDTIRGENEKLYAHVYVRHLGDLSGGQMIMRKTPDLIDIIYLNIKVKEYKRIVKERIESYLNLYEVNVLPKQSFVLKVQQNYLRKCMI